ncbi:MAG TPA: LacI family DNA-binding transcriptional regulator, partial [Flavobacteriales bacterium]|nr:LacI family DNA-binding transcriptional regulator [Flavobacteriales bacterium]
MKKITLEDIAKSLGVSKTLVSLILNNKAKEHGISPDTVDRVLKKVKEMNYMPNQAARGLRTGKTNLIGLIVADISNPFYARISRAIEDLAWKKDYHLMVCSSDEDPEKEAQLVRILREKMQVEGLIISPTTDNVEVFRDLKKIEFPFVLIDRNYPKFSCNSVVVDNIRSSQSAVKHLIDSGAKRV